jgi:uncharacterized protein YjbI with pentapeptide repeats
VPLEVYQRLERASPEERTDIVLELIQQHPEGRLELPKRGGMRANLHRVDLSRRLLTRRRAELQMDNPAWWHSRDQGAALEGADLRGANLTEANLEGAHLWTAKLADAQLTHASLRQADLWRVDLRGAALGKADLRDATLGRAALQGSFLRKASLQGAVLRGADLRGADLEDANLRGADLRRAKLQEVALTDCDLTHIYINGAWLQGTRLDSQQLGWVIGEELVGDYDAARQGYLSLKHNFGTLGDYQAASWAHGKERRMEKLYERQRAQAALVNRQWRAAMAGYTRSSAYQLVEWLCDYGESISRVLVSLLVLVAAFTIIYALSDGVVRVYHTSTGRSSQPTENPTDLLLFSLATITRVSAIELAPRNGTIGLVAGVESFLGVALTGLLGFVVGYRIRRG